MTNEKNERHSGLMRAAADLFPGYFALVMATGIISIAANLLEMRTIALVLLVVNVIALSSALAASALEVDSLLFARQN